MLAKSWNHFLFLKRDIIPSEFEWEKAQEGNEVAEGPFVLKHKGKYYLTYTANDYLCIDYAVGYAVSDSPLGEYKKYSGNPVLKRTDKVYGTGHHSFTTSKDGKKIIWSATKRRLNRKLRSC